MRFIPLFVLTILFMACSSPAEQPPYTGDESAEEFGYIMPLGTTWQPVLDAWFNADGGLTSTPRYRAIMEEHLGSVLAGILLDQ